MLGSTTSTTRVFRSVCSGCGRVHSAEAWSTLAFLERMSAKRIREVVLAWPSELAIEVRQCDGCGVAIARKVG
jgi:hypothetical protein